MFNLIFTVYFLTIEKKQVVTRGEVGEGMSEIGEGD